MLKTLDRDTVTNTYLMSTSYGNDAVLFGIPGMTEKVLTVKKALTITEFSGELPRSRESDP